VPDFPMFAKSNVNGDKENPVYTFLKARCTEAPREKLSDTWKLLYSPIYPSDIRWNFEKILVDYKGRPVRRYRENTDPRDLEKDIREQLKLIDCKDSSCVNQHPKIDNHQEKRKEFLKQYKGRKE